MTVPALDLRVSPPVAARGIALRRQEASDRGFTRDLYAAHRAAELAMMPWDDTAKAVFVEQQFTAQSAHLRTHRPAADYLIVTRDAAPIGRLYVDRGSDPWRLIEIALVHGETRRGIGAALVGWLIGRATSAGAGAIDLHVAIDNIAAAAFYARLGFADVPSAFASHRRMIRGIDRIS